MAHYVIFPVGDWSCDGHNTYADFMIKSDKPLQEIKEVHFLVNEFIGDIANSYEDNEVSYDYLLDGCLEKINSTEEEINIFLKEVFAKYHFNNFKGLTNYHVPNTWIINTPEQMIGLWVSLLNWFEPALNLEVISEAMSSYYIKYKGLPFPSEGTIINWGYDEKERHLKAPGYGIWIDYEGEFVHN